MLHEAYGSREHERAYVMARLLYMSRYSAGRLVAVEAAVAGSGDAGMSTGGASTRTLSRVEAAMARSGDAGMSTGGVSTRTLSRNERIPSPSDLPRPVSRLGPKQMSRIARIINSSGTPISPITALLVCTRSCRLRYNNPDT